MSSTGYSTSTPGSPTGGVATAAPEGPAHSHREVASDGHGHRALRQATWVDSLFVVLVVALAFLLGSFPARNSDLWLHLATGRALVDGSWRFGPDPFVAATTNEPLVAHSWLYDLASYGLFVLLGGTALVIIKSMVLAALAFMLVRLGTSPGVDSSPARPRTFAFAGTLLSLLVVGGRAALQPTVISYLFLAATLWLLGRPARLRAAGRLTSWWTDYGPLMLLFALWANIDDWYVLGPATVVLYLLGQALAPASTQKPAWYRLALAVPAGLLACLLTPWHVHGLTLPTELVPGAAGVLQGDPAIGTLFLGFFDPAYRASAPAPVVLGAVLLALFGLTSFAWSMPGRRSWRLPVFLGFLALALWRVRAVPFFAVVAGPVLARNCADLRALSLVPAGPLGRTLLAMIRGAAVLLGGAVVLASWPGWLQGRPYGMRGWTVEADPSLQRAAQQITAWQQQGQLPTGSAGFNFSTEAANTLAWFCPTQKSLLDARLGPNARIYVALRRMFLGGPTPANDWREALRQRKVHYVVLHDPNHDRLLSAYARSREGPEWPLVFLDGRTPILAWRDPAAGRTTALADASPDFQRLAFDPPPDKQAPPQGPDSDAEPWYGPLLTRGARSPESAEAELYLAHFDAVRPQSIQHNKLAWDLALQSAAVGIGGPGALGSTLLQGVDLEALRVRPEGAPVDPDRPVLPMERLLGQVVMNHLVQQDDGPYGLLLLAIRSARRAVQASPDDARAYLSLGEAYLYLLQYSHERTWCRRQPLLGQLRQVQGAAAFTRALELEPNLLGAHEGLAVLYRSNHVLDLATEHLGQALRLRRLGSRQPGETDEQARAKLDALDQQYQQAEQQVRHLRDRFEVNAGSMKVLDKANSAVERGLLGKALEVLRGQRDLVGAAGKGGVVLELELLLRTGQVQLAHAWLEPAHEQLLGKETYHWFRACSAAASGDYDTADTAIEQMAPAYVVQAAEGQPGRTIHEAMGRLIVQGLLDEAPQRPEMPFRQFLSSFRWYYFTPQLDHLANRLRRLAEADVVRGQLALEQGTTLRARELLQHAVDCWGRTPRAGGRRGIDFTTRPLAQHLLGMYPEPK